MSLIFIGIPDSSFTYPTTWLSDAVTSPLKLHSAELIFIDQLFSASLHYFPTTPGQDLTTLVSEARCVAVNKFIGEPFECPWPLLIILPQLYLMRNFLFAQDIRSKHHH